MTGLRAWLRSHPAAPDWVCALAITATAAALRLVLLGEIPYGLHPDEAQVGTDAQRILDGDFIGVYTHAALGQPSGHAYLSVPAVAIFGHSIFAVRITLALLAIAAVPLLYALVRLTLGRAEAVIASSLLAVSYWHLLYSRVAHWSISYGTVVLAVLLCLALGMRSGRRRWFVAGGLLFGLGVYTYNIYPIAVVAVTVALTIVSLARYRGAERAAWLRSLALFFAVAFVVALPMIVYVANPDAYYWTHVNDYRETGLLRSDEFEQASFGRKAGLIREQAWSFVSGYTWDADPDIVDANGQRPVFDPVMLALLVSGAFFAWRRRREPMVIFAVCCLLIVPLPAVLQRGSVLRQPVAAAPFAALVAALPLAALWHALRPRPAAARAAALAAVAGVVSAVAAITVRDYFFDWRDSSLVRFVYHAEVTTAANYIDKLPDGSYVYFYSDRHPLSLETVQFLAPHARGEDRSFEFSPRNGSIENINRSRYAVFVLIGRYRDLLRDLRERYPDGRVVQGTHGGKLDFVAYELPPSASARSR